MLRELKIESFKSYRDQAVPVGPLTVLVGPNGSGKTSVLQGIEFLGALVHGTLRDELDLRGWEYRDLPWRRGDTQRFGFTAKLELDAIHVSWWLQFGNRRRPGIAAERVSIEDGDTLLDRDGRTMWRLDRRSGARETVKQTLTSSWLGTLEPDDATRFPELVAVAEWAKRVRSYVTLDPAVLRAPSRRTSAGMGPRGEDLAGFLRWLRDHSPTRFDRMLERVRARYPNLRQIVLRTAGFGWFRVSIQEEWGGRSVRLEAPQVSDGLLRLIAIAAMHELPDPPAVVMIDEIENGLHPHLLGLVVEMLEELALESGIQVIATTHNPIAVNFISDPSNVLVVWRDQQGRSTVTPLDQTRGFERLSVHLDAGELWYNIGEADLLGAARD